MAWGLESLRMLLVEGFRDRTGSRASTYGSNDLLFRRLLPLIQGFRVQGSTALYGLAHFASRFRFPKP